MGFLYFGIVGARGDGGDAAVVGDLLPSAGVVVVVVLASLLRK